MPLTSKQFIGRLVPVVFAVVIFVLSPSSAPAASIPSQSRLASVQDAWAVAPVDTSQQNCSGIWNVALAINSADVSHIAYRSGDAYSIIYAQQTQNGWSVKPITTTTEGSFGNRVDIEVDSLGFPHIVYTRQTTVTGVRSEGLYYTRWNGVAWVTALVKQGAGFDTLDLALTKQDQPRLMYKEYESEAQVLHYVALEQTSWTELGTIEDANLGGFAIDSQGRAHVALRQSSGIVYRRYTGSDVLIETVESPTSTGEGGLIPDLTLDADDNPHIAYPTARSDFGPIFVSLHYAKRVGEVWQIETPTGALPTSSVSITMDATAQPHIIAQTTTGLYSFVRSNTNEWTRHIVATPGADQGFGTAVDPQGNTRIAYCGSNYPQSPVISYAFQVPPRAFLPVIER